MEMISIFITREFTEGKYYNMTRKNKIEQALIGLTTTEKIAILESLCKRLRRENSIRMNATQMGRRTDSDRPDLELLKN